MRTSRYFCWSLSLPIGLALMGLVVKFTHGIAAMALVTSPVYVPLAIWACHRIKRAMDLNDVLAITMMLPLQFSGLLLVASCFFGLLGLVIGLIAAGTGFLAGYAFVALAWAVYVLLKKTKMLTPDLAWEPETT